MSNHRAKAIKKMLQEWAEERERRSQGIKKAKRVRQPAAVRQKHWADLTEDEPVMPSEPLAPPAAAARRTAPRSRACALDGTLQGRVIEVSTGLCRVKLDGQVALCALRGNVSVEDAGTTNHVAVGDEVMVTLEGAGNGVVEHILPRRSALARPDVANPHRRQVIVANADQLLIVAAWRNPPVWFELLDRYLITAALSNLRPLLCLNKVDLAEDEAECRAAMQPYEQLGYAVCLTSAETGRGVAALRAHLRGQVTVLAGLSGVGKSTLLSAVQPGLHLKTGQVSADAGQGRHTTTQVNLWPLEDGGAVIDTPGIREFGLQGVSRRELQRFFPDILRWAAGCRFADCSHVREDECAVADAARAGHLAASRYHSYGKIYASLPE